MAHSPNYVRYITAPVEIWVDQAGRLGGPFDPRFGQLLAAVINVSEAELTDLLTSTQSDAGLRKIHKHLLTSDAGLMMAKAYTASLLVRGRYHQYLAEAMNQQILHHPMRESVLPPPKREMRYSVSNVVPYLAAIALESGRRGKGLNDRINAWATALLLLRRGIANGDINMGDQATEERAIGAAVEGAERAGIVVPSKRLEFAADLAVGVGLGALTSFGLSPWDAFWVGLGGGYVSHKLDVGNAVSKRVGGRRRLHDLAVGPGGRVRPLWGTAPSA